MTCPPPHPTRHHTHTHTHMRGAVRSGQSPPPLGFTPVLRGNRFLGVPVEHWLGNHLLTVSQKGEQVKYLWHNFRIGDIGRIGP